jgi:predicted DNA-binding protein with PD1-like motif
VGSTLVRSGNIISLRLEDGSDLLPELKHLLEKEAVKGAVILSAIGMLRNFTIGWLGPEGYVKKEYNEPYELLSISGTVNIMEDGGVFIHPHAALSGRDHSTVGGHLFSGVVHNTLEAVLLVPEGVSYYRKELEEGGYKKFCPQREEN